MKLDNMFKKTRIISRIQSHNAARVSRPEVPEGLLRKCNKCGAAIITEDVKKGYYICPKCGGYFRVHAYRRIQMVIDEGTFEEWDHELVGGNSVDFPSLSNSCNHVINLFYFANCSKCFVMNIFSVRITEVFQ